jgi:hypothetical protein
LITAPNFTPETNLSMYRLDQNNNLQKAEQKDYLSIATSWASPNALAEDIIKDYGVF